MHSLIKLCHSISVRVVNPGMFIIDFSYGLLVVSLGWGDLVEMRSELRVVFEILCGVEIVVLKIRVGRGG